MKHTLGVWSALVALYCHLVIHSSIAATPTLVRINGGNSAGVIDSQGDLWIWGDLARLPQLHNPALLPWQPRRAPSPPDGGKWRSAAMGFLLVGQSDSGALYVIQRARDMDPLILPLEEPAFLGRGSWSQLEVGGSDESWASESTRSVFVAALSPQGEVLCWTFDWPRQGVTNRLSIRQDTLPFPAGVTRWDRIAAGYGYLLSLSSDGRMYRYNIMSDRAPALSQTEPVPMPESPRGGRWTNIANITGNSGLMFAWNGAGQLFRIPRSDSTTTIPLLLPTQATSGTWTGVSGGWPPQILAGAHGDLWTLQFEGPEPIHTLLPIRATEMASALRFTVVLGTNGIVHTIGTPFGPSRYDAVLSGDFPAVRGPVAPFLTPALVTPVVTIEAAVPAGASPENPDAPATPAVFRLRRTGDASQPLMVPLYIFQQLSTNRMELRGLSEIYADRYSITPESATARFDAGSAEKDIEIRLRYTESGGAPLRFGLKITESTDYLLGDPDSASVRLLQTVPTNPLPQVTIHPLSGTDSVPNPDGDFMDYEILASVKNGTPLTAAVTGTNSPVGPRIAEFPPGAIGSTQRVVLRVAAKRPVTLRPSFEITDSFGRKVVRAPSQSIRFNASGIPRYDVRITHLEESHLAPGSVRIDVSDFFPAPNNVIWLDIRGNDGSRNLSQHRATNLALTVPIWAAGTFMVRVSRDSNFSGEIGFASFRMLASNAPCTLDFATNRLVFRRGETGAVTIIRRGSTNRPVSFRLGIGRTPPPDLPVPRGSNYSLTSGDYELLSHPNGQVIIPEGMDRETVFIRFPEVEAYVGNRGGRILLDQFEGVEAGPAVAVSLWILENKQLPDFSPSLSLAGPVTAESVQIRAEAGVDLQLVSNLRVINSAGRIFWSGTQAVTEFRYIPADSRTHLLQAVATDRWGRVVNSPVLEFETPAKLILTNSATAGGQSRRFLVQPAALWANIEVSTNLVDWETLIPWEVPRNANNEIVLPGPAASEFYRVRFAQ